jgi:threonine dehydratase
VATVVKSLRPDVRVVTVEPENAAGFRAALACGKPTTEVLRPTVADGLAVARVGATTFAAAASRIDDAVCVSEREIGEAMALLARRCGAVVEGAGAAALAAVLAGKVRGRAIVVPVCGRNVDARVHAQVLAEHATLPCGDHVARAA